MSGLVRAESLFRARRRAERRRRTARPLLALAIVTTVVGAAFWVGFSSPLLRLTSVTVKGTSRLTPEDVLAVARVPVGRSLLQVPTAAVRRRVAGLAAVARVGVARSWPHGLVIDVVERTPAATIASSDGVVLVDANGVAFGTAVAAPSNLLDLRITPPATGTASAATRAALRVWDELPPSVQHEVRWMSAPSPDAVSFRLARGATVVWGSADEGSDKLAVLASLMRQPAATYDVSTPAVAVTR